MFPKKTLAQYILTEDDCETAIETVARRGPLTRGGGSLEAAIRGPLTRGGGSLGSTTNGPLTRGGVATGGTVRGGTTRGGTARGGLARGGANASSSSNQPKGKCIVTTVEKGIEIIKAKRKRKNPDWKP